MIESVLLAFAIGVKSASPGRAFVFVRDDGPPALFEITLRQRDSADAPWVDVEDLHYFPGRPTTSKTGRKVTIALPQNLQRLVQVCAATPPSYATKLKRRSIANLKEASDADAGSGLSAVVNLRFMSCVNLPQRNTGRRVSTS